MKYATGTSTIRLACALLAALLFRLPAMAQESGASPTLGDDVDPKTTTRVRIGSGTGGPGELVEIPIFFTPAQNVETGELKVRIEFVSVNLKFQSISPGVLPESSKVDIKSETEPGKNDKGVETTVINLTASVPSGSAKGLPSGVMAYMTLAISEKGKAANIALRTKAEATTLGSKAPIAKLRVYDAQVGVLSESVSPVTCFFFSH